MLKPQRTQIQRIGTGRLKMVFPKGSSNAKGIPLGRSPWDLWGGKVKMGFPHRSMLFPRWIMDDPY